jgi:hypothetical protein
MSVVVLFRRHQLQWHADRAVLGFASVVIVKVRCISRHLILATIPHMDRHRAYAASMRWH